MSEKEKEGQPLAIDRVRRAFSSARRSITVPEWDGLELYFSPLTSKDVDAVDDRMRTRHGDDRDKWPESIRRITTVVLKAEDEDGKPAFRLGDINALAESAHYLVMLRVYTFLHSVSGTQAIEDAKKKSEKTRGSGSS